MIYWMNGPPHYCRAGYAPGVRVAFAEEFASRGRVEKSIVFHIVYTAQLRSHVVVSSAKSSRVEIKCLMNSIAPSHLHFAISV